MVALLLVASMAHAQTCGSSTGCNAVQQAAEIVQPQMGIGLSGGNPVAGASSTLGMRIGSIPRVTLGARLSGVRFTEGVRPDNPNQDFITTALNFDAAVGIFSGFRLVPTIGGFGSIDAVLSIGTLRTSDDKGFEDDPGSWAIGARLGILRESFTAPGVSVTAMYRHIGDLGWEAPNDDTVDPFASQSYELTDNSAFSLRAVVGKRLFVLGATAGIGYDKYKSTISGSYSCVTCGPTASFNIDEHKSDRTTIFGNVSWTLLILNVVAEGGWQSGGDAFTAPLPSGQSSKTDKSTAYGSLAVRLVF
jgi:hypothetical protein